MESDEILMRIKRHYLFFDSIENSVEDKYILEQAKKYMEFLFFELLKNNLKNDMKSKL